MGRAVGRVARRVGMVAVLAAIVGVGWWQIQQSRAQTDDAPGRAGALGVTLYPDDTGVPAPQIEGKTVEGDSLSLSDLRGYVVVLNVWGSWCAPCREEAPDLVKVSQETESRGVRFVGIDVRDTPAAARAFANTYGITYPSWDDQSGFVLAQFTGIVPVRAVPSTIVIDREGIIRARVIGKVEASTLRDVIAEAEKAS